MGQKATSAQRFFGVKNVTGVGRLWFGQNDGICDPPMVKLRKKTEGGAVPTPQ
jgi:hypothetical protein